MQSEDYNVAYYLAVDVVLGDRRVRREGLITAKCFPDIYVRNIICGLLILK
jgi:hypothetical protein